MKKKVLVLALLSLVTLAACGKKEAAAEGTAQAAATPAAAPAATTTAAADPALKAGEDVFKKTCVMCHQTGAAGAPMLGNKGDWQARVAQGKDTLYKHALEGFTGEKGAMPARGGNSALSDADVKAAVDFMVSKVS
ncbi:c-type cytochrome [Pseudogulbenkiania ferrooxidans]|uniref:Cytochrome c class I n=1 Tax=Pseudogulbenkiania ferrooxidans 2002 TaxID=279714 RepID=B9YZ04_9NEIS|nr:c-type cytochrome [Pseudogulbenkiania ferrooxidans]EEG10357.1 cytochrome c class I [Pseudogulbenkiania ferrooxidans 2002]